MTSVVPQPKIYTVEEYLNLEVASETRNEYRDGDIVPMSGGTPDHNELIGALNAMLRQALRGQPYRIFSTDQRLWIPARNTYTYPDIMVVPHPIQLQEGRRDTVINPVFMAEILSNSTKDYDRGDKFAAYRTISTFQEYLLIDHCQHHTEHYLKQDDRQWLFREYDDHDSTIRLASLDLEIAWIDLYENVEFEAEI